MTAQEFITRKVQQRGYTPFARDSHIIIDEPLYRQLGRELSNTMTANQVAGITEFMGYQVIVRRVRILWELTDNAVEFGTIPPYLLSV